MFIFWDGEETRDAGYCLFGASVAGKHPVPVGGVDAPTCLQGPYLRTADMLNLLLSVAGESPGASHCGFNFDYDVNQILRELSWKHLITLKHKGKVSWRGYRIEHIPGKIFKVSDGDRSVRVDDCFSFFRCRYDKALEKWGIGSRAVLHEISVGKDGRDDFYYRDIADIRSYWAKEVQYGCYLMEKIKSIAHGAGYKVSNWHGPGALAAWSLKSHGVTQLMAASPGPVLDASLSAYAGGWFERFRMGRHRGDVYTYDINSAYVYAMSLLPNLANGRWVHHVIRDRDHAAELARAPESAFGLFRYKWRSGLPGFLAASHGIPFPLFHRETGGSMRHPSSSDGWTWTPEAAELSAIPYARLTEAWIYEHNIYERPFGWVADDYASRLALKRDGDPSEKILKWALASYYGRLAQRTGWNEETRSAPPFHQIEWAGWITSKCRAMIFRAALASARADGLVSIDTDGIISLVPVPALDNGFGDGLGQWKEEHFDELVYLQNGVYWLRDGDTWVEPKLRGIPKAKFGDPAMAIRALESGEPVKFARRNFCGYRAALGSDRSQWRQWGTQDIHLDFVGCGSRVHVPRLCGLCRGLPENELLSFADGLHSLSPVPSRNLTSAPHKVPWLTDQSPKEEKYRKMILAEEM